MRIKLFELEDRERHAFAELQEDHEVSYLAEPLTADRLDGHYDAEVVSTFIDSRLGAEVLEQMPSLRLIATRSTGFDHIDPDYCEAHGITVSNVPTYGDHTVAEQVVFARGEPQNSVIGG